MVLNFTLEVCQQCHNSARGALVGSVKCNPGEGYFDERYKGKGVTKREVPFVCTRGVIPEGGLW